RDHAVRIFAHLVNYCEVPQNKVTVLSQYRAQCSEITRDMEDVYGFKRPNVSTVIASQGDEWDYVILSTVRSMPQHEIDKRPTIGWLKVNLG
ncbi:hypothetical protein GH877_30150, partial [Bacillus thuringiensis]|nr:hypothetical protein [Bacillus thuringiensis]